MSKIKVLLFARSFLAKYYSDIQSDIIEPILVTLTHKEKVFLENKGWKVYGCFEDEYEKLEIIKTDGNYLKTSLQSDRFLNRFEYEKRIEILGKEISFWRNIIENTRPSLLVNETVAVEIAEVMAIEAHKKNIPFLTYLLGFIPNTFYWKPSPFDGRLSDISNSEVTEDDLKLADDYINKVVNKYLRPFYVSGLKKSKTPIVSLAHNIYLHFRTLLKERKEKNGNFRYEDYSIFSKIRCELAWAQFFNSYNNIEDLENKELVFYPMHVEPEATLNYFVDENFEQTSTIHNILGCLKENQYLIVKEHPQQHGMLLTKDYQNLKKKNKNLIFLSSEVLSFSIIKKCKAVVTFTSSAAWEALLFGKPVFVLGKIFFDQCSGATRIDGFKQLKLELRKSDYQVPDKDAVREFAAKLIHRFKKGCPSPGHEGDSIKDFIREIEKILLDNKIR